MMDEYIPSPRHTPNKPRRMRDVSALYPVNEKQLLLEAIMKQQHESPSCDTKIISDSATTVDDPDASIPSDPPTPPQQINSWKEKQTCPVCHWPGESSSSSSGTSEYDGDESDASSACQDCQSPRTLAIDASSSSSSSEDEDEGEEEEEGEDEEEEEEEDDEDEVDTKDDSPEDGGIDEGDEELEGEVDNEEKEDDDSHAKSNSDDTRKGRVTRYFGENAYDHMRKGMSVPKSLDRGHCLLGREVLTAPGKLLYGRHSVYYRGNAIFRPQANN